MSEEQKTHVLTQDCILPDSGRCDAGKMISESDVMPSTWSWLNDRGFLKSVTEIEKEADAAPAQAEPAPPAPAQKKK